MGNIHVKLYEIFTSGSEELLFKGKSLRTDDGQRPITIAHLEPSNSGELKMKGKFLLQAARQI